MAFDELYLAVHAMLVARLLHGQDSAEFLKAINRVIDAHDQIASKTGGGDARVVDS